MLKSIKLLKDAYIAGFMHRVYKAPAIPKPSASKAMKKYIVCHVPHLPALTILLGFLYPSKIAKFTSLVDGLRPNH